MLYNTNYFLMVQSTAVSAITIPRMAKEWSALLRLWLAYPDDFTLTLTNYHPTEYETVRSTVGRVIPSPSRGRELACEPTLLEQMQMFNVWCLSNLTLRATRMCHTSTISGVTECSIQNALGSLSLRITPLVWFPFMFVLACQST